MSLDNVDPRPISEAGSNSIIYVIQTPPETVVGDTNAQDTLDATKSTESSVPWPGSTFIIRSILSGEVITVYDGKVTLAPPGGRGSIHWVCVETEGWIGFRNLVTGRYLGHDPKGRLCCSASKHRGWENFCVRSTPDGGYVLLMTHFEKLWPVGIKLEQGAAVLAKIENGSPRSIDWEFIKV